MDRGVEFCQRMIKEWSEKSRQASEDADLKAFEQAELELKNYQTMLAYYEKG
ncbi:MULTISPECIES: hypothetical protein [Neisseria]|uniref:hypothetical protein n=1 Tax=Neisseria TaxID=482 RepID=UPI000BA92994|nr:MULTISPECIES: hypothetical protein [Neisseria]